MSGRGAAARRRVIRRLLERREVRSQRELVELLATQGFRVTQPTVSRDLDAVGARKVDGGGRGGRYVLGDSEVGGSDDGLAEVLEEFALSVVPSGGLVVVKTPPGAAQVVAGAIDRAGVDGVVGTVAGDDTLLVVAEEETGGRAVADRIEMLGRSGAPGTWEAAS